MSTLDRCDFDFGLGEELDEVRAQVRRFARERIAPRAEEIDRSNEFPRDLWPELGAAGLLGVTVPERWGGANLGYLAHIIAMEEISRASGSVGLSYGAHSNLCMNQIVLNATDEQRDRYLPKLVSGEHVGALASGAGALLGRGRRASRVVGAGDGRRMRRRGQCGRWRRRARSRRRWWTRRRPRWRSRDGRNLHREAHRRRPGLHADVLAEARSARPVVAGGL